MLLKRIAAVVLSTVVLLTASFCASAENPANNQQALAVSDAEVMPCFDYTSSTVTSLSISNDVATCSTGLNGYSNVTKIVIKMTLQKKTLLWWSKVESWTATFNNVAGAMTKTASVGSGTYRVKVEFTVYSGSDYEEITAYSQEKKN